MNFLNLMKKVFSKNIAKKSAFTLAEILVTMMIIGVIATMTLPTLTNNVNRKQFLTSYKKMYAELTQVIKLSTLDNQDVSMWDYSLSDEAFMTKYISPYLKITKCTDCWITWEPKGMWFETPAYAAPSYGYCFNDYTSVEQAQQNGDWGCADELTYCIENPQWVSACTEWVAANIGSNEPSDEPKVSYRSVNGSTVGIDKKRDFFYLYIDTNSETQPNVYGVDKFVFVVSGTKVLPYGFGETDLTAGDHGCSTSGDGMYCGAVIMKNDWDFPSNYPKL